MNDIIVKNQICSLCNSKNTTAKVEWVGDQYKVVIVCKNANCIINKLNKNEYTY